MLSKRKAFTLIELLVVVLIIGILAAVAWPQYKHAVLKSRFSAVMPMAKALADAQEVYYEGRQMYALGSDELDITPVSAENIDVKLSGEYQNADENYEYVAAWRTDIPNARYIMYQKHSPKFAGNIHCEAKADDDEALWLCEKGLHGTEVTGGGSIQGSDYKTYLLAGAQGADNFASGEGNEGDDDSENTDANAATCKVGSSTFSAGEVISGSLKCETVCDANNENCETKLTGGGTYDGYGVFCKATSDYACAGSTFSGSESYCSGDYKSHTNPCTSSEFSGIASYCYHTDCSNSTFSGKGSICYGTCRESTFSGEGSGCRTGTCAGSTFMGQGSYCLSGKVGACDGATFGAGTFCYENQSGTNKGCSNVIYRTGSSCSPVDNGKCAVGSPHPDGGCWDGNGNQVTCTTSPFVDD